MRIMPPSHPKEEEHSAHRYSLSPTLRRRTSLRIVVPSHPKEEDLSAQKVRFRPVLMWGSSSIALLRC